MSARTTLKDVAQAAGVSQMTVSRVVRGDQAVSLRTRERVQQTIEQIGYVPNKLAGSLAHARSNQVAVIIPSLVNNVFSQVLAGITAELEKADYNPVVGVTDYNLEKEEALLISMMSWRPAAVIVTNLIHTDRTISILRNASVPVVEIMDVDGAPIDMCVGLKHDTAAQALADHLVSKGYQRFGYLGWQTNDYAAAKRFKAFRERLEARGYGLVAPEIYNAPPDMPAGKAGTDLLLKEAPLTDVIVYSNDTAAMGGALFCQEKNIALPDDMAIAGFSGLRMGQCLPQPMTTIRTFRLEIGQTAARNVLKVLSGVPVMRKIDLGFELIDGQSA
ncbi:LacI family DNA-binding transcriptional regulator [Rhodophyticola sp. CCM32]|uniref:LacI family DNA-binding transcriptional regulator n=1 Tax=Rhodophyticola sp. CCM32 TaxID=2916397 RepID=UPI00107F78EB|nr:LacI family DNA-binding transcriptional regulator [Rhodophyticola sp. CCM32]QBY01290.1 LacI family DNA-binding transcriptional regulator [Rhodophyticola sp. CCM32]